MLHAFPFGSEKIHTPAIDDTQILPHLSALSAGVYTVSASHPSWKLDGAAREVKIDWGNAAVAKDFTVTGYDLTGSVVADGNPILGVQVSAKPPRGTANIGIPGRFLHCLDSGE